MNKKAIIAGLIAIAFLAGSALFGFVLQSDDKANESTQCHGTAACFAGKVTAITDGDTIKVEGNAIRLALTSTPELHESGGIKAREFTLEFCPVGTLAVVDEDDGQREGSFGRTVAAVYCSGKLLNSALLDARMGTISKQFCEVSEFGNEDWAKKHGC